MVNDEGHHPPADALQQLQVMVAADRRADAVKFFMKDMIGLPGFAIFIMKLMPIWSKLKAVAHTLPYDVSHLGRFFPAGKESGSR